ncbi:RluA family pseudouridine synthase [Brevibacillus choshinensis]|uniref:Pseudouridine synthase n=1 Tax=Brevibacillus choshinensis TaxID=54911 RepID=A0ABX7FNX3_BRECH|nr:RluA family pseudouridine synthase [Brevibacillus choshinensis]QRG67448.1 RluA family pseudouridine synthase [Brevibacillus choshinensis]
MSRKDWIEYTVTEEEAGMNVEQIVRQKLNVSGRMMQRLTRSKGILLNRKQPFLQRQVKAGDQVAIRVVERQPDRQPQHDTSRVKVQTQAPAPSTHVLPVELLYEDDHLLIANKPAGMMVHPIKEEQDGTLVHALAAHFAPRGEQLSIHPVHRLDKDTSGAILLAKSSYGHQIADRLLREGGIHREYVAVVSGVLENERGTIDAPIGRDPGHPTKRRVVEGGDAAITHYEVIQRSSHMSMVRVWLETGRTHQIRVHFEHIGHPLAGDTMYGGTRGLLRRQALHASSLAFHHPLRNEKLQCEAPLPTDLKRLIAAEFE